jgi:hypothetical protein
MLCWIELLKHLSLKLLQTQRADLVETNFVKRSLTTDSSLWIKYVFFFFFLYSHLYLLHGHRA